MERDHLLSNKVYSALKLVALIIVPALATFVYTFGGIWDIAHTEEVVKSLVAFDTFLGVIVKLGEVSYNGSDSKYDGAVNVQETSTKTLFSLDLNQDPEKLAGKDQIKLKVNTSTRE